MTYSSACGPVHSIEEFLQAFILPYPYQSINSVFVTATKTRMKQSKTLCLSVSLAPLLWGQLDVILHPDIDHVTRGPHDASAAARHGGHGQTLSEPDLLSVGRHALLGHLVDGEPGGGVGELSE